MKRTASASGSRRAACGAERLRRKTTPATAAATSSTTNAIQSFRLYEGSIEEVPSTQYLVPSFGSADPLDCTSSKDSTWGKTRSAFKMLSFLG